jgi:hypothetical protein
MSRFTKRIRERQRELYKEAKAKVKPNENRSVVESQILDVLTAKLLESQDPQIAARRDAIKLIDNLTKHPGESEDDDDDGPQLKLSLPKHNDTYSYDPERLIKDSVGNIIEEKDAPFDFKVAEMARSGENLHRASTWHTRKTRQVAHFQEWMAKQIEAGRPLRELTWGNCIKETGILREK